MIKDEEEHANSAIHLGGVSLPVPIKVVMKACGSILTKISEWG
jgi:demethoxyubiquinone hydroxylase (CLK1/Coq7/Cat5 family)